jgi:hypothetical protein
MFLTINQAVKNSCVLNMYKELQILFADGQEEFDTI